MLSELGQYVDKDHDNADNSSKKSHNKSAPKEEEDDETTSAFDNYIKVRIFLLLFLLCNQSQTN